jgi:hypothetical protein
LFDPTKAFSYGGKRVRLFNFRPSSWVIGTSTLKKGDRLNGIYEFRVIVLKFEIEMHGGN